MALEEIDMEMTAVVLNAGLGDISFGLQMAGFSIIAAYETDLKAAAVHEANIEDRKSTRLNSSH